MGQNIHCSMPKSPLSSLDFPPTHTLLMLHAVFHSHPVCQRKKTKGICQIKVRLTKSESVENGKNMDGRERKRTVKEKEDKWRESKEVV